MKWYSRVPKATHAMRVNWRRTKPIDPLVAKLFAALARHPGWEVPLERGPTPISEDWRRSL